MAEGLKFWLKKDLQKAGHDVSQDTCLARGSGPTVFRLKYQPMKSVPTHLA